MNCNKKYFVVFGQVTDDTDQIWDLPPFLLAIIFDKILYTLRNQCTRLIKNTKYRIYKIYNIHGIYMVYRIYLHGIYMIYMIRYIHDIHDIYRIYSLFANFNALGSLLKKNGCNHVQIQGSWVTNL